MLSSIQKVNTGLTTSVKIPQPDLEGSPPTTFEYKSPNPDLSGQMEVYSNYLSAILSQAGINAATILKDGAQSFTSGLDRAIANADVTSIIAQNQNDYISVEKQAFEIVKAWSKVIDLKVKFSEKSELQILFPKPKILISDKETLENIKLRMDLGLITKVEALRIIDPNLTEEEAKDRLDEIKEERAENAPAMIGSMEAAEKAEEAEETNGMGNLLTALRGTDGGR